MAAAVTAESVKGARARPQVRSPRLVGREAELAQIAVALSQSPAVVLVEGEPGVGKSRLVREYLDSRSARAGTALMAVCPPFRQPFTLGPVVDALRQATDGIAGLGLSALAGALRPLFPEWADGMPPEPPPLSDASAARHRLFRSLAELLDRLGTRLLVAEDAHWADEATLEFLLYLVSRPGQQVSLLTTYRPEDVPEGSLLRRLSSPLPGAAARARICLQPLDIASVSHLASSMLDGEEISAEFAEFLHERTAGLPLAVEESVRLLHDRAQLIHHAGQWERRSLAQVEVPPTVRDSVLERLERLGSSTQAVLRAAAVLTDSADESVLTAVTRLTADRVRVGVAEALSCGLLYESQPGMLGFRHVLACKAVYEAILAPERRRLHLRAGRALEKQSPLPVARLASHFREARDTSKWCQYAERAAEVAAASGDDNTAISLLHGLLTSGGLPARRRSQLAVKLAAVTVSRRAGETALARQVVGVLRDILRSDGLTRREQARIRGSLGRLLCQLGEYEAGRAQLERAIPGLEHDDPAQAIRAMIYLGWPMLDTWPAARYLEWLRRADGVPAGEISPADRLSMMEARATALIWLGEEEGWTLAAKIPATAETADERCQIASSHANISGGAMLWGRYVEARRRLAAGLELADAGPYPTLRQVMLANQAELDWLTGSWEGLSRRAAALAGTDDAPPLVQLGAVLLAALLDAATGSRRHVERRLRLVLDEGRRAGALEVLMGPAAALGRLLLADGKADDALAVTERPARTVMDKGFWVWATEIMPVRTEVLLAVGRCEEAGRLVAAFAQGLGERDAPAPQAALISCRAILAEEQGEAERAAGLFARAAAAWQALPRPYDALLARERQACCLLAVGKLDLGLPLLTDACRGLSGLGARTDADRTARRLGECGIHIRSRQHGGRRGYGDRLSPRELEVVRLVATGRTNREIAQFLCRSPNTIAVQLNSALRKLGISSRTALAVWAIDTGVASASGDPDYPPPGTSED